MQRSVMTIPKMDCKSEEAMVRMALDALPGRSRLQFDLPARRLTIEHETSVDEVLSRLSPLNFGATIVSTEGASSTDSQTRQDDAAEARTLRMLLGINATMFVIEIVLGFVAQSTGLIADALDMFADAAVYGVALFAVGRAALMKVRAARIAGWIQLALAVGVLIEVARRLIFGSEPMSVLMISVAAVALVANVVCLPLVAKHKNRGVHMKASFIFSSNDVIANVGVILAGVIVAWSELSWPDLVIGTVIAVVVANGARRILQLQP